MNKGLPELHSETEIKGDILTGERWLRTVSCSSMAVRHYMETSVIRVGVPREKEPFEKRWDLIQQLHYGY